MIYAFFCEQCYVTATRAATEKEEDTAAKYEAWGSNSTELLIRLNCREDYKAVRGEGGDSEFMMIIACRCVERKASNKMGRNRNSERSGARHKLSIIRARIGCHQRADIFF